MNDTSVFIPDLDPHYEKTSFYDKVLNIVTKSHVMHYTAYIKGHKGCGKTLTIRQVCAVLKRPYFEFQITPNMLSEDYIGVRTIENGQTSFKESTLIKALRTPNAVLNLDEFDKADSTVLELQNVLEGRGVLIKKTGEYVKQEKGVCIFATANTLGRGQENNLYNTSNILDASTIDRFTEFIDADFISEKAEAKLVENYSSALGFQITAEQIITLCNWTKKLRDRFDMGISDGEEFISTRGIKNIISLAHIHNLNINDAVKRYVFRYNEETSKSFYDLFRSLYKEVMDTSKNSNKTTSPKSGTLVDPSNPFA